MSTGTFLNQTVDFDEWEGSPSRTQSGGVSVITVMGTTAWTDIDAFITFLMPVGSAIGGVIGATLAANNRFRVFDWSVEGFGGLTTPTANGLNAYQLAKWNIKCHVPYSQLPELSQPFNTDPVPLLQHRMSIGGQFLTIPQANLQWTTDQKKPSTQVFGAKYIGFNEHNITWPRLLNPPMAAIRACMGKINNAPVVFATGTIATGQGLFLGAEVATDALSDGSIVRTLTYKISERVLYSSGGTVLDWNYSKRDDGNAGSVDGWDKLQTVTNNKFTYETASFSTLFPNTF